MSNYKLKVDNIYWERVQLFIEGHAENYEIKSNNVVLRNFTETTEVRANGVEIDGNKFKIRFNVAILDNGNYLPADQYLLIFKDDFEHIVHINEKLLEPENYNLEGDELEIYNSLETTNDKNNFLLNHFKYEFKKGGT
ncbi:CDP-glycerol glycerophosphotransferase family protein, partial [Staphylococcus coagulans]|nr:CDP-glycerol glycerophosphotransferase family protein [Staphylococcus coagulans]